MTWMDALVILVGSSFGTVLGRLLFNRLPKSLIALDTARLGRPLCTSGGKTYVLTTITRNGDAFTGDTITMELREERRFNKERIAR